MLTSADKAITYNCQMKLTIFLFLLLVSSGCEETTIRNRIHAHFAAWNRQDFDHEDFKAFLNDSILIWHNKKIGNGQLSVIDPNSGWKQWDKAWNGSYQLDSVIIDTQQHKVTANFAETNDFNKLIGMPEGYRARVTYWLDSKGRVKEVLYDWADQNPEIKEKLKPIVEWALENDSSAIAEAYLQNGFQPSATNAAKWKKILNGYLNR